MSNKNWKIAEKVSDDIVEQLLANRGVGGKEEIKYFLEPTFPTLASVKNSLSIDNKELEKGIGRIKEAIKSEETIVIHGDYDVDGLCATAILWETIYFDLGYKNVHPFIPDRFDEGYGLSIESIDKMKNEKLKIKNCLLITVDCGITAVKEVEYAKSLGIDVIVTDHHTPGETRPEAVAVIHTSNLSGAGIAWFLSQSLLTKGARENDIELVSLATIADLQPLLGVNRSLVRYGLESIKATKRAGLKALIGVANVGERELTPYIVGWWLAPRLNAMGRLENALDSLRLLCTKDMQRAYRLARKLNKVNFERQQMTNNFVAQAREMVDIKREIQVLYREEWHEGVIGLVAGKIKEEFYRPTIAISMGEEYSKGSARSIAEFNIIEALRLCADCLVDVGGHPMAAGFTIETSKIMVLEERLSKIARESLSPDDLSPVINVDAEIKFADISWDLLALLKKFEPHGVGNPRPIFLSKDIKVQESRTVGADNSHLKLFIAEEDKAYPAIGFGLGHFMEKINIGDKIDLVYKLSENEFQSKKEIQIEVKDLKQTS